MRANGYRLIWLLPLLLLPVLLLWATGDRAVPAHAAVPELHLDLVPSDGKSVDNSVPPDCSTWHELYPAYCTPHHQTGYDDDNGNGKIDVCEHIYLDGICYHIVWVGPTYFLSQATVDRIYEPEEEQSGGDPTCETWHEIYPDYCFYHHVDGWEDNSGDPDGVLDECDNVFIDGIWWHIDRIGLDIIVVPDPTATDKSSWGKIKSLFRRVF